MSHEAEEPKPEGVRRHSPGEKAAREAGATGAAPEEGGRPALIETSQHYPFGPLFFMIQLRGFAGEKCPDASIGLPIVELHLADGETLELCHVIGVAPTWVALAVIETGDTTAARHMRTEFVPFETIARVTLRPWRPESPHLGFEHSRVPRVFGAPGQPVMTPEAAIEAAARRREDR